MPGRMQISTKRIMIDKANSTIVMAVGIAAFLTAFSLVSARSLFAKHSYQRKVIAAQEKSLKQLEQNVESVKTLKEQYAAFVERQENVIKGSSTGSGDRDGDNARIILDALPSKYDYPALASSLEKILMDRNYVIEGIEGIDDEAAQTGGGANAGGAATTPAAAAQAQTPASSQAQNPTTGQQPAATGQQSTVGVGMTAVEMPFKLSAKGSYENMTDVLDVFSRSIRPLQIQILSFSADTPASLTLSIEGKSFYLPGRTLNITEEIVP